MLSKAQLNFIKQLQQKKYRKQHGRFLVEGEKAVAELIASDFVVDKIFGTQLWYEKNLQHKHSFPSEIITQKQLNEVSQLVTPNQVIAMALLPQSNLKQDDLNNELILVLDGINDPGNLGTLIRTADWFGISHIICSNNTVDAFNFKSVQATMGSLFRCKLHYVDLPTWLLAYKVETKLPIYVSTLRGQNIYNTRLATNGAIVIGNESHGVSNEVIAIANHQITIPPFKTSNQAESLNAGIAGALMMAAFRQQSV
ncbi:MAG: RNA methyltransferase [Bacteroidia bacterium]|nr:RNA methyltransferase [Bacteroidia bacterium]